MRRRARRRRGRDRAAQIARGRSQPPNAPARAFRLHPRALRGSRDGSIRIGVRRTTSRMANRPIEQPPRRRQTPPTGRLLLREARAPHNHAQAPPGRHCGALIPSCIRPGPRLTRNPAAPSPQDSPTPNPSSTPPASWPASVPRASGSNLPPIRPKLRRQPPPSGSRPRSRTGLRAGGSVTIHEAPPAWVTWRERPGSERKRRESQTSSSRPAPGRSFPPGSRSRACRRRVGPG